MLKKYIKISHLSEATCRLRLKSRCNESIQADLLSSEPAREQKAIRALDFQYGLDQVFTSRERLRLRQIMIDELKVHPNVTPTVLCYGIAALSVESKAYYAKNGIVGDAMYERLAKQFKEQYSMRHRDEAFRSLQKVKKGKSSAASGPHRAGKTGPKCDV